MEIPDKVYIDPGFKEIATRRYTEQELKEIGCKLFNTGHYHLPSSKELSGIDLVFEKHSDGKWGVTTENRRVLFDIPAPENLVSRVIEEIENGKLRTSEEIKNRLKEK